MPRKTIVVLLIGLVLALARFADAQQQAKVTKIGWLGARSASAPAREVFARELRALGYETVSQSRSWFESLTTNGIA